MKKHFDPATSIQSLLQFGEYGDVNPSVTDSATFTFMQAKTMLETFKGEAEGCFLYSRHWNPSNKYLADALAAMEGTEAAWVTASGMGAITCAILQLAPDYLPICHFLTGQKCALLSICEPYDIVFFGHKYLPR